MGGPGSGPRRHRVQRTGLLGAVTQTWRPVRVLGTEQRGGDIMPPECPKCHAPWLETSYWEARCLCGRWWYRTVGEMRRPDRASERAYPHIKEA